MGRQNKQGKKRERRLEKRNPERRKRQVFQKKKGRKRQQMIKRCKKENLILPWKEKSEKDKNKEILRSKSRKNKEK